MRLFIAIKLPDDVKRVLGRLRIDIPGARWVLVEQIHLTLAFLGEVEETTMGHLIEELSLIKAPEFELCFSGTGCFPDHRRPRVLWIGLQPEARLIELVAKINSVVLACDISLDERPFSPHITLARLKIPASGNTETFLSQPRKQKIPSVSVQEFILFQSQLNKQGAVHIPIKNFPLATSMSTTVKARKKTDLICKR